MVTGAFGPVTVTLGALAPNTINKTLTRLSQMLGLAVEYELISANPAAGKRRRVKSTKPRRPWVEPEKLMSVVIETGDLRSNFYGNQIIVSGRVDCGAC